MISNVKVIHMNTYKDFEGYNPHSTLWYDKKDFDYSEAKIV